MDQVYVGMTVEAASGPIGVVEAITDDPTTGTPQVIVQRDNGEQLTLTTGMYMIVGDVLQIDEAEREVGLPAE